MPPVSGRTVQVCERHPGPPIARTHLGVYWPSTPRHALVGVLRRTAPPDRSIRYAIARPCHIGRLGGAAERYCACGVGERLADLDNAASFGVPAFSIAGISPYRAFARRDRVGEQATDSAYASNLIEDRAVMLVSIAGRRPSAPQVASSVWGSAGRRIMDSKRAIPIVAAAVPLIDLRAFGRRQVVESRRVERRRVRTAIPHGSRASPRVAQIMGNRREAGLFVRHMSS